MNCLCRPSRNVSVRIVLLDETDFLHEIKDDLSGQTLLDVVFARLNLIETAYFGLRYLDDENQTHWMDPSARISRQLRGSSADIYDMYFGVKFYAADPTKLIEEITRYQLFLQVKQDVLQGRLPVSFELAAELGAFIIQSELGDYDARRHSIGYVSEFRLVANQTRDMEGRVTELHQQLKGMTPSAAELSYLDKVKWHDMYGVDLHPVLGEDSVEYYLGLTPSGIVVLRNKTTVAYYYWPRIAKVYFKGRYFMLRVCDKNNDVSTYGFETPRKSACRHLWRCCVEHHAFFRLVRVTPVQSQDGPGELFSLGSRFRYSGRTEKQAVRDAVVFGRSPPIFKRMPSRRQPRRSFEELLENVKNLQDIGSIAGPNNGINGEIKSVSIPQPAQQFDSPYRSTCHVPTSISLRQYPLYGNGYNNNNNHSGHHRAPDSPRSTRSAPWSRTQQKGLFGTGTSPRSVRSASSRKTSQNHLPTNTASSSNGPRFRSSSVESQSSNDSRSCKKHRHKGRRTSDNESELSRGSGRSHNSHRKHRRQRSRHRRTESGSDNESSRARSFSGHRKSSIGSSMELVDSNEQWHDVQRRQAELTGSSAVQQASVMKSSQATSKSQSNDTDSHSHGSSHHRSRRHKKNRELAKHLQFGLVETAGMTEDQLREIPYTVVETHTSKRAPAASTAKVHKNAQTKDRVDRIRGIYVPETVLNEPVINGSIRSASTMSSRDCERNSSLVRMMSSLSMGDFISPSGSCLSPMDESGLRVSHEHTDSGLGADQDYAYSSERSSDSAKYGTNKSSGASVTSGHHTNPQHNPHNPLKIGSYGPSGPHESVSNRKPPVHPNHSLSTPVGGSRQSIIAPVHSSNNRLYNNTTFQNNQYTFGLNRDASIGGGVAGGMHAYNNNGGGYLSSHPLAIASPYAVQGTRTSRGTKSDIGISSCRRPSTSSSSTTSKHTARSSGGHSRASGRSQHQHQPSSRTSKMPSVKSEFLLSYLSQSANMCELGSPYHISSGVQPTATDYLEHYKASLIDHGRMYPKSSSSTVDVNSISMGPSNTGESMYHRPAGHPLRSQYQHQTPSDPSSSRSTAGQPPSHRSLANASTHHVGPLLYLDSAEAAAAAARFDRRHHQSESTVANPNNQPRSDDRLPDANQAKQRREHLSHYHQNHPQLHHHTNNNNNNNNHHHYYHPSQAQQQPNSKMQTTSAPNDGNPNATSAPSPTTTTASSAMHSPPPTASTSDAAADAPQPPQQLFNNHNNNGHHPNDNNRDSFAGGQTASGPSNESGSNNNNSVTADQRSNSLELILKPIIQSSRRAQ